MGRIQLNRATSEYVQRLLLGEQGFAWWYVDLLDGEGSGLTLVWSYGLPFLAGSRSAGAPQDRPAVALSLYRRGRPWFYLLNEHPAAHARLDSVEGSACIGDSCFEVRREAGEVTLTALIDEPISRSSQRISGVIRIRGPAVDLPETLGEEAHVWQPRSFHAGGEVSLSTPEGQVELSGGAYFDSNFSRVPLHRQGIERWHWGRLRLEPSPAWGTSQDGQSHEPQRRDPHSDEAARTVVFYQVDTGEGERELRVLEQRKSGALLSHLGKVESERFERGLYGLRYPARFRLEVEGETLLIETKRPVDDGPFYQRFLVQGASTKGASVRGVVELLEPGRLDIPWQRPFIRMRTHHVCGKNSFWLPLFSGGSKGRLRRLLGAEGRS